MLRSVSRVVSPSLRIICAGNSIVVNGTVGLAARTTAGLVNQNVSCLLFACFLLNAVLQLR